MLVNLLKSISLLNHKYLTLIRIRIYTTAIGTELILWIRCIYNDVWGHYNYIKNNQCIYYYI